MMSIGQFPYSPYLIAMLSSFVISFALVFWLLRGRYKINGSMVACSLMLNFLLIIFCAKLYTVILSGFRTDFLRAGLASIGGMLGLVIGVLLFNFIYGQQKDKFILSYVIVLPLLYSISKIGCFLAGCCHGIPYEGPFSVQYHNKLFKTEAIFPVQLLESVVFFGIFLAAFLLSKKAAALCTTGVVLILCAVSKFLIEYLREEHIGKIITPNQVICVIFIVLGAVCAVKSPRKQKNF